jgi:hypothetical protein
MWNLLSWAQQIELVSFSGHQQQHRRQNSSIHWVQLSRFCLKTNRAHLRYFLIPDYSRATADLVDQITYPQDGCKEITNLFVLLILWADIFISYQSELNIGQSSFFRNVRKCCSIVATTAKISSYVTAVAKYWLQQTRTQQYKRCWKWRSLCSSCLGFVKRTSESFYLFPQGTGWPVYTTRNLALQVGGVSNLRK